VYQTVEDWSVLDACYFMVVTWTTVGYGDLAPVSTVGRLYTCASAVVGTTAIISSFEPAIDKVLSTIRCRLQPVVPLAVDTSNDLLTLAEVNKRIVYTRRYLRAALGPLLLLACGVTYGCLGLGHRLTDSIYFCIITMTTVGYGTSRRHRNSPRRARYSICPWQSPRSPIALTRSRPSRCARGSVPCTTAPKSRPTRAKRPSCAPCCSARGLSTRQLSSP